MKHETISKISAPRISEGILSRERLFTLLDRCSENPIVWISSPAGSGKTTLVASYLKNRALPSLWYGVDEKDDDPASFFSYMGVALQKQFPTKRRALPSLTPDYLSGLKAFARRYFRELFRRLPLPAAIVLDNYQNVAPHVPFHEAILEGLSLVPQGLNVIVLSRNEPHPLFTTDGFRTKLSLIDWNDVRFSFDETKEFIGLKTEKPMVPEVVTRLYEKTEGWIAALRLIMETPGESSINHYLLGRLSSDEVFNYFASEIFDGIDGETKLFLLKTAFIPGLNVSTAEKLTGVGSAERILSRLDRNHFFTIKHSRVKSFYTYHPLFRDFLLSKARKTFTPAEMNKIREDAAGILEVSGRIEDAVELLIKSADWAGITRLILRSASTLIAKGRNKTLQLWLEALPQTFLQRNAWLLYWLGISQAPFDANKARMYLGQAYDLFEKECASDGIFLSWSAIVSTYPLELEDWHPLDDWIERLSAIKQRYPNSPSKEIELQVNASLFVALVVRPSERIQMLGGWEGSYQLLKDADAVGCFMFYVFLFYHNIWSGNYNRTALILKDLQRSILKQAVPPHLLAFLKLLESQYYWVTAQCDLSDSAISEGTAISEAYGFHALDYSFLSSHTENIMIKGDDESIQKALDSLNARRTVTIDHIYYYMLSAWWALLQGNLVHAQNFMIACSSHVARLGSFFHESMWNIGMAQIFLAKRELASAKKCLEVASIAGRKVNSQSWRYAGLLTSACIAFLENRDVEGLEYLREAMKLGREQDYVHYPWWQPSMMSELCAKALENGIEKEYARKLIMRRSLTLPVRAANLENWPWSVRIRTLGRFQVEVNEKPLVFTRKVQKKPLGLLMAIIAMDASNVSEETIEDLLWPEADGDASHLAFKAATFRLRRLLSDEQAVEIKGGKVSLNPQKVWVDTWAFKELSEKVSRLPGSDGTEVSELRHLSSLAADIYGGDFLAGTDDPWVVEYRRRLQSLHRKTVGKLTAMLIAAGEMEIPGALGPS